MNRQPKNQSSEELSPIFSRTEILTLNPKGLAETLLPLAVASENSFAALWGGLNEITSIKHLHPS